MECEDVILEIPIVTAEEEINTSFTMSDEHINDSSLNTLNNTNKNICEPQDDEIDADSLSAEKCGSGGYSCQYCSKKFITHRNRRRHIYRYHKLLQPTRCYARCIECDLPFASNQHFRDHLSTMHNLDMECENLKFPNMNAFYKWKHEVERRELSSFTLRNGMRQYVNTSKYIFICHRSGKPDLKIKGKQRQRIMKTIGSCKIGITCTAAMYVQEKPDGVVVRYCPHHYGHGKDTYYIQLSKEEQAAIQENVSNGLSFESLLDDIKDTTSDKDNFQLHILKKKDFRFITNAFKSEDYTPHLSDPESVEHWVSLCLQMEDSPVLYYHPESVGDDGFVLTIMTEFQKHILLSSPKKIICLDSLYRKKGSRFYLFTLFVIDDQDIAFPVAFCITSKIDKNIICQFVLSIRESTGPISVEYFMSDSDTFYYDAWKEVMNDSPRWLWSMWWVDTKVRSQLKWFKGDTNRRAEVYKNMRKVLECQNKNVFHSMFNNFMETLSQDVPSKNMLHFIQTKFSTNYEMWAYCYRKEINFSVNFHLECLHKTFRYLCREGRKKRLDKFIFILMRLVRHKMLDRLSNVMDEDKIQLAVEAINMCHSLGLEIPTDCLSPLSDKTWIIRSDEDEGDLYVTREFDACPEHCNLQCSECDICVHMFSCSCLLSLINANLCQHIHAVVWKFLTPHFSPPGSPSGHIEADNSIKDQSAKHECSSLVEKVLKKAHTVYNLVKENKCTLTKEALTGIIHKLNDCLDIGSGKQLPLNPAATPFVTLNSPLHQSKVVSTIRESKLPSNSTSFQTIASKIPQSNDNNLQYYLVVPPQT